VCNPAEPAAYGTVNSNAEGKNMRARGGGGMHRCQMLWMGNVRMAGSGGGSELRLQVETQKKTQNGMPRRCPEAVGEK